LIMIKKISLFVFSVLFIVLLTQFVTLKKATAAASNQTETKTTTFNISGGNGNDANDANGKPILKANKTRGYNVIGLDASLNGRTAELPVGTLVFLHFPTGNSKISINPDKGIVEGAKGRYNLPNGDIALLRVVGQGSATITVTTKEGLGKRTTNAAHNSTNWSGYERTGTNGSFTDITSYWTVPTASSCGSGDTYSSAWVGIDDGNDSNHDLIQTGTESDCVSGSPFYRAWWEILPAVETPITSGCQPSSSSCSVSAGDSMFAEIKKNSTNWTITIIDYTQGWTFSTNQTYSGPQSSSEWILEAPTDATTNTVDTLTHYGSTSFTHDTLNGANPQHSYATDSWDMFDGSNNKISTTSYPNGIADAFAVQYGANQPASPKEWNTISSPSPSTTNPPSQQLYGVTYNSANNAWAVGYYQTSDGAYHSLIEHWDGTSWTQQTEANIGTHDNFLYSVKALSATNIWAVGYYNNSLHALIEHSTDGGSTWSQDTSYTGAGGTLYAIDGDPATGDAWAVGTINGNNPLVLHLSSGSWSSVSTSADSVTQARLFGVSEDSSDHVWVVGDDNNSGEQTFTMYYNGSWTNETSPNPGSNGAVLKGVVNLGSSGAWAVGYEGNNIGFLTHWNGSSWSSATTLSIGSYSNLDAVAATDANNIWAVGYYGVNNGSFINAGVYPLVYHSGDGGSTWQLVQAVGTGFFNNLAIDNSTGNIWGVGSTSDGLIEQYSSGSYNSDVLNDGAIGYWTLSNATGSSSGLTDLTSTQSNMTEIDVTHGASKINASADYSDSYNGTSSSTYASSVGGTLYTAKQNFSIEAWVKPTSIPSLYNIAGIAGKNGSYWLALDGPHLAFTIRQGGTNKWCDDTNTATANTIYHLVGTYDGSTEKLYINGSLACSASETGDVDMNSGAVVTGSWDTSVLYMQGYESNVAIYNGVLSSTQVATHYNDGKL
jgi:Peptidase A4 family/Concanavalin A-like lectin/glucanases superfamily